MKKRIIQKALLLVPLSIALLTSCKKSNGSDASVPANGGTTTGGGTITTKPVATDVTLWLTKPDKSALLQKQNIALNFSAATNSNPTITVDTTQTYQTIDGFGFALTGGSASLINSLSSSQQSSLLNELFLTDSTHIGISYLRISIGASDLSSSDFTYDELSGTQTSDVNLQSFSINPEMTDLVPVLKKIVAINPNIKIIATPWTAPTWMKTNGAYAAGHLNTAYYDTYAKYFVKYIQAMEAQGIKIEAVTPQNEPLNANNNPSMVMYAREQINFIKNNLGPAFKSANLSTKIICYDHNLDRTDYADSVLNDQGAAQYVDGSAFHLYSGDISSMNPVHNLFPDKNLYFTEQYTPSTGAFNGDLQWHVNNLIIGATRNWSRNVLEWNLASDPNLGPHTSGGCTTCLGALTIGSTITRNVSYYIIAHASKFVPPGSVRIASNVVGGLQNVAFKTPAGKKVLIVLNTNGAAQNFNIQFNGKTVSPVLDAGAVGTFTW